MDDTEHLPSSRPPPQPVATATISLTVQRLIAELTPMAAFKMRSHDTSRDSHLPALSSKPEAQPLIVLFGDSMIERMTTTGSSPSFTPWPSPRMLPRDFVEAACLERLPNVVNCGVGGDRYANMIYRLVGNAAAEPQQQLGSLLEVLAERRVKLWVVQGGTNNLHAKKGLRDEDVELFQRMLAAMLEVSPMSSKIIVTGLFPRLDIPSGLIDEANGKIARLVSRLNENVGRRAFEFLPPTPLIDTRIHLADHVHLNAEGYQTWTQNLFHKVNQMLTEIEESDLFPRR